MLTVQCEFQVCDLDDGVESVIGSAQFDVADYGTAITAGKQWLLKLALLSGGSAAVTRCGELTVTVKLRLASQ